MSFSSHFVVVANYLNVDRKIVTDLIHKQTAVMSTRVRDTLELESTPFTQNGHYYQVTKAKYLSLYKDARSGKLQLPIQEPKRLRSSRDEDGESYCIYHESSKNVELTSFCRRSRLILDERQIKAQDSVEL